MLDWKNKKRWFLAGYVDAQEIQPYKRAPRRGAPLLPDGLLLDELAKALLSEIKDAEKRG